MKKIKATILSLLTLATATTLCATGIFAQKSPSLGAKADLQTVQATAQGERLLSPTSYQQYLTLVAPTDVAVKGKYTAISDGNVLHLCNETGETPLWHTYTHPNRITKLQFGSEDVLYFLDGDTNALYTVDVAAWQTAPTPVRTEVVCTTFTIKSGEVYYANTSAGLSKLYRAPLNDLNSSTMIYESKVYSPSIDLDGKGDLYFVYGSDYLWKLSLETGKATSVAKLPDGTARMLILDGTLYCTTENGEFFAYSLTELTTTEKAEDCIPVAAYTGDFSALSLHDKNLYLVKGNTVREFSLIDNAFTSHEIGAASDSVHRLNGGSQLHLYKDKLFIADDNNDRISVYNQATNGYEAPVSTTLDNPYMAADEDTLLVASGPKAILYSLQADSYGKELAAMLTSDGEPIVGATCIYGDYYVVTKNDCYLPQKTADGYTWQELSRAVHHDVDRLTSDVEGNLYVLKENSLYRYTEETFNSFNEVGEKLTDEIPSGTSKIAVDYGGNIYALANDILYRFAKQDTGEYTATQTALNTPLVYGVTPTPLSFAFGIEENAVYTLYQENYVTVTDGFNLPTVKNISTETAPVEVFSEQNGQFSIVKTAPKTLFVEFDFEKLQNASVFPYTQCYRSVESVTALKIAQTTDYALLAYRKDGATPYQTFLVPHAALQTADDGQISKYENTQVGYLTNDCALYKYPSMGLPQATKLARGEQLTVTGEIAGLDCDYYEVSYGDKLGYIPKSYVAPFNGAPSEAETVLLGNKKRNGDAIWRLSYLVLGSLAICILVDFLLLRKSQDDEN